MFVLISHLPNHEFASETSIWAVTRSDSDFDCRREQFQTDWSNLPQPLSKLLRLLASIANTFPLSPTAAVTGGHLQDFRRHRGCHRSFRDSSRNREVVAGNVSVAN